MHSTCLTLTLQTKTIAIRCASLTRSFCHFQQVSRYISYRDPGIAIRIVSWGYRIVTTLYTSNQNSIFDERKSEQERYRKQCCSVQAKAGVIYNRSVIRHSLDVLGWSEDGSSERRTLEGAGMKVIKHNLL